MKYPYILILCGLFFFTACGDEPTSVQNNDPSPMEPQEPEGPADPEDPEEPEEPEDPEEPEEPEGPQLPPQPWSVFQEGPYRVGYHVETTSYQAVGQQEPRQLRIAYWYPTFAQEGRSARYNHLLARPGIWANAEPATREPRPVLIFSHGNASFAEQNFFMTEFFASHGWVVAACDHQFNTAIDNEGAINLGVAPFRPQDISATLDHVLGLPDEHLLAGLFSDDIVLSGHSFGGYTTLANTGGTFKVDEVLAACEQGLIGRRWCDTFEDPELIQLFRDGFFDDRIRVSIPMTPAGGEVFDLSEVTVPTLLMTGALDITLPNEREGDPLWDMLQGSQHRRLDFLRAGHFTFTNMCEIVPVPEVQDDGCGEDFVHYSVAFSMINAYALAFSRLHLFGDESVQALVNFEDEPFATEVLTMRKE